MAKVAVRCENNNKKYDGRVWLEPIECIVEHNGKVVTPPLDKSTLNNGDAVKVRWGKGKKLWNGVVAFLNEEECPSMSEVAEPKRKRKSKPGKEQPKSKRVGKYNYTYIIIHVVYYILYM